MWAECEVNVAVVVAVVVVRHFFVVELNLIVWIFSQILTELLIAAHEHQQNIRQTLSKLREDGEDDVTELNYVVDDTGASVKSDLHTDMNEAIMVSFIAFNSFITEHKLDV